MSILYQEMKDGKSLQDFNQKIKKSNSLIMSPKNVKKLLEDIEEVITTSGSLDQSKKLYLIGLIGKMEESINENMKMNDETDSEEEGEGEKPINDSEMIEESEVEEENEDFSQKGEKIKEK